MNCNKRIQSLTINLFLLMSTLLVCLLAGELLCRIVLEPVDYLRPELIEDPVLRYHIEPGSAGHDAWGQRNIAVPEKSDIITIGDSQTYGVSAPASHSWPRLLARLATRQVYNLALGGYCPLQYNYLLQSAAIRLSPKIVLIGLYPGNDFMEAYRMVYVEPTRNYWNQLQDPAVLSEMQQWGGEEALPDTLPVVAFRSIRTFLEQNSILYRAAVYSPLGDFTRLLAMKKYDREIAEYASLEVPERNLYTAFQVHVRGGALDLSDFRVREGIRLSKAMLLEIQSYCDSNEIRCIVLMIPIKERVYANYIEQAPALASSKPMRSLLQNEKLVRADFSSFFSENGIEFLDLAPGMQEGLDLEPLYPSWHDGHPNKAGNRVLASAVAEYLKNTQSGN